MKNTTGTTTSSLIESVLFPSSIEHRRQACLQVASKLARKRLLHSTNTSNNNPAQVVYRSALTSQQYTSCSFLDPRSDIVLALDASGRVDVVRVATAAKQEEDGQDDGYSCYHGETIASRPLAVGATASSSSSSTGRDQVCINGSNSNNSIIRSIRGGHAFVVGGKAGAFHVFATEHASTWCAAAAAAAAAQQQQQHVNNKQGSLEKVSLVQTTLNPATNISDFLTSLWRAAGPTRRYPSSPSYSLAGQIQSPGDYYMYLQQQQHQSSSLLSATAGSTTGSAGTEWDFYETGSTLLAAHINNNPHDDGGGADYWGLRILDHRTSPCCRDNQVVVDMEMDRNKITGSHGGGALYYNLSTPCFLSELVLATSCTLQGTASMIQLWDLRWMKQPVTQHCVLLPSFPLETVHATKPMHTFPISSSSSQVLRLCAMVDGRLLVSTKGGHFHTLDPSLPASETCLQPVFTPKTPTGASTADCCFAFNRLTSQLAWPKVKHPVGGMTTMTELSLLSVLDDVKSSGITGGHKKCASRKRSRNNINNGNENYPPNRGAFRESSLSLSSLSNIGLDLRDQYGCTTDLSCLSFCESGTSLVGGTYDGDIFVIR